MDGKTKKTLIGLIVLLALNVIIQGINFGIVTYNTFWRK